MSDDSTTSDDSTEYRVPVDEDERTAFHEGIAASGRETTEDDIDEVLY